MPERGKLTDVYLQQDRVRWRDHFRRDLGVLRAMLVVFVGFAGLLVLALAGPAVFSFQVYVWLRYGTWPALPLINLLPPETVAALRHPHSWYGLARLIDHLLEATGLALSLCAVGWWVIGWLVDKLTK